MLYNFFCKQHSLSQILMTIYQLWRKLHRKKFYMIDSSGLYFKHITVVRLWSTAASLIDDAKVVIYDCNVFIIEATS